jgi:hypothetical protein
LVKKSPRTNVYDEECVWIGLQFLIQRSDVEAGTVVAA